MITIALRRVAQSRDEGIVLVTVIGVMLSVSLLVTAGLAYGLSSKKGSRNEQDRNGALAAAQAGIDDYVSYLNRNDNYARQSPFSDCANMAMKGPRAPQPNSCGWTSSTAAGWRNTDAGGGNDGASFHYDISAARLNASGVIDVKSTGRVNGVTRTLQVAVGRGGSTDFLYYTNHEDADPDNPTAYPSGMNADCSSFWHGAAPGSPAAARSPRRTYSASSGCREITFIGGDVLDGQVHLNDTPLFSVVGGKKPKFLQGLETSDPKCKNAVRGTTSTYGNCDRTGLSADYANSYPRYADPLYLPDNSAAFASYPGCAYSGATRIIFNANGTMNVSSQQSRNLPVECGGDRPLNKTVPVPTDKVIYVKADGTPLHQCASGEIDGVLPLGTRTGLDTQTGGYTYDESMLPVAQQCGQGNVYVQGTLKGRVTVAAQNSIVLTGDLKLAGGLNGSDLAGLVAGNSVEVFHPLLQQWECTDQKSRKVNGKNQSYCAEFSRKEGTSASEVSAWPVRVSPATPADGIDINASIQTLQHSFFVQSYNRGSSQGTLVVTGSIAQQWRGIVGQTNPSLTGYLKDYRYDKRLKYSSPPYFPQFINATWTARTTGEISPAY